MSIFQECFPCCFPDRTVVASNVRKLLNELEHAETSRMRAKATFWPNEEEVKIVEKKVQDLRKSIKRKKELLKSLSPT